MDATSAMTVTVDRATVTSDRIAGIESAGIGTVVTEIVATDLTAAIDVIAATEIAADGISIGTAATRLARNQRVAKRRARILPSP